jgi:hypothetical protein
MTQDDQSLLRKRFEAFLASRSLIEATEYARRGRALKEWPTEDLKQQWTRGFTNWSSNLEDVAAYWRMNEAGDELTLRNVGLPFERVADEIVKMCERFALHMAMQPKDEMYRLAATLLDELQSFEAAAGNHH